jgi:hypothetical protein
MDGFTCWNCVEVNKLADYIEQMEASIARVEGLLDKAKCTAIPSEGDQALYNYPIQLSQAENVVKRSELKKAIKGEKALEAGK